MLNMCTSVRRAEEARTRRGSVARCSSCCHGATGAVLGRRREGTPSEKARATCATYHGHDGAERAQIAAQRRDRARERDENRAEQARLRIDESERMMKLLDVFTQRLLDTMPTSRETMVVFIACII
ncbi:hypothetical protein GQ600_23618 [Phytophthora cactorum]|nr:hypothetical protein GQ600_23618 [Phytophthora cactorum]